VPWAYGFSTGLLESSAPAELKNCIWLLGVWLRSLNQWMDLIGRGESGNERAK
jgi:hypothetical protein